MAYLRGTEGDSNRGTIIEIAAETSRLGRHPSCEIVLDNNAVSREHARIVHDEDGYAIEDLHSRNGTFVNGVQITQRVRLKNGDSVRICGFGFLFFDDPPSLDADQLRGLANVDRVCLSDEYERDGDITIKSQINMEAGQGLHGLGESPSASGNAQKKLKALINIGRNLGAQVDQVLPQLLDNLLHIFDQADCAYIILTDEQTKRLELRAFRHRDPNNRDTFRVSRTILEKVAHSKSAILSDDVANDSRFDPSESIVNYNIYSIMAAPIMDYDQSDVLGVVQVDARTAKKKFSYEDLDLLVSVAYQVAVAYQNALMQEAVVSEKMIERELTLAHKVQMSLLPIERPVVPRYEFFDFYKPARYLGGDYYDYIALPDGRLVVALGDVSGKGVAASLFMSKHSAEVRTGLLLESDFGKMMSRLNRIYNDPRWENRFITFFFGILDPKADTLTFYNAGHVPPIFCDGQGGVRTLAEGKIGLPLGVVADTEYREHTISLQDGETLIVISDGLTDAMNASEEYFGMGGVLAHLRKSTVASVEDFGTNLINAVQSFAGRTRQTDDQSMLVVGRRDANG